MKNKQNYSPRFEAEVLFTGTTTAELYAKYNVTNAQDLMLALIWKQLFNSAYVQDGTTHDEKVLLHSLDLKFAKAQEAAVAERKLLQTKLSEMVVNS